MLVLPSPKDQLREAIVVLPSGSVLASVNTQLSWVQTSEKPATGGSLSGGVGTPPPSPQAEPSGQSRNCHSKKTD